MYINRITFSITEVESNLDKRATFHQISSYFEELLYYHLPKKSNLGGYGYFNNELLYDDEKSTISSAFDNIIEYTHYIQPKDLKSFFTNSLTHKIEFLIGYLKQAISEIAKKHPVDEEKFYTAISNLRRDYLSGFEQKLKVSKHHRSRKLRVDIVRIVTIENENIICRIINKKDKVLAEFKLAKNTSVYDASYDFRKSKWDGNILRIVDRFDESKYSIDVSEYIN